MKVTNSQFLLPALLIASLLMTTACGDSGNEAEGIDRIDIETISANGELEAVGSQFFGPPSISNMWNFTIAQLADDGVPVSAGTPILAFDTKQIQDELQQKSDELNQKTKEIEKQRLVSTDLLSNLRLQLEEARAEFDKAKLKAEIPRDLVAANDWKKNQLNLELAENQLNKAKALLDKERQLQATELDILQADQARLQSKTSELRQSIQRMRISAPSDGLVIHATDWRNNKSTVGESVWRGRRVVEFSEPGAFRLHLEVPERALARLQPGTPVEFRLDAVPEQRFRGELTEIGNVVRSRSRNQPARVVDAWVRVLEVDESVMRPGMSATATLSPVDNPSDNPLDNPS